jgi:hypothetical protein
VGYDNLPAPSAKFLYEIGFFFGGEEGSTGVVSMATMMMQEGKREGGCEAKHWLHALLKWRLEVV